MKYKDFSHFSISLSLTQDNEIRKSGCFCTWPPKFPLADLRGASVPLVAGSITDHSFDPLSWPCGPWAWQFQILEEGNGPSFARHAHRERRATVHKNPFGLTVYSKQSLSFSSNRSNVGDLRNRLKSSAAALNTLMASTRSS